MPSQGWQKGQSPNLTSFNSNSSECYVQKNKRVFTPWVPSHHPVKCPDTLFQGFPAHITSIISTTKRHHACAYITVS